MDTKWCALCVSADGTGALTSVELRRRRWQWVLNRKLSTFPAFFSSAQETNGQGPGKVHFGFLAFWLSTHSRVLEACRAAARDAAAAGGEQRRRRPRVLVTGMSLGAGAAAAGLLYLAREVPEVEFTAVFFGLPRAGDRRYVRQMEVQENITGVYRVMYENDLVAHYPIPLRFGGYRQPEGAWLHLRADAARSRWRVHRWAWLLGAKAVGVLAVNKLTCGAALSSPWMDHDMENTYHKGVMEYVQRRSGE